MFSLWKMETSSLMIIFYHIFSVKLIFRDKIKTIISNSNSHSSSSPEKKSFNYDFNSSARIMYQMIISITETLQYELYIGMAAVAY